MPDRSILLGLDERGRGSCSNGMRPSAVLALYCVAVLSAAQRPAPHIDTLRIDSVAIMHANRGHLFWTGRSRPLYHWPPREGYNVIYRPSGVKYLEGFYMKRSDSVYTANGPFTFFNEDGSIRKQGVYRRGRETGVFLINDDNGIPLHRMDFGRGRKTLLYPDGSRREEGRVRTVKTTRREFRKGRWKFYCPDGNMRAVGRYNMWGKVGKWVYHDTNEGGSRTEHYPRRVFKRYRPLQGNAEEEGPHVCGR